MLSEGGTWQLVEVIGSGKVEELCSIEGVAGELQCFKLHCQDPIYRYYYAPTPCDISVDIEYALDVERESVVLEITGGGIIGEKNKYTTTFNIDVENPLLYKSVADNNGYIGGKIAAVYKDFEYKKTKSIIITYDSSGKYSCE